MHHIVSDGWSMGVILSELSALYERVRARPALAPAGAAHPVRRLRGLAARPAQRRRPGPRARLAGASALAGAPALLELPTDRPRPAVQRFRGGQVQGFLPDDLATGGSPRSAARARRDPLHVAARRRSRPCSPAISGSPDVVVGTPVAGRNRPETEDLIGFFVNTLVLRADLGGDPSFRELIARVAADGPGRLRPPGASPSRSWWRSCSPQRSLTHSPMFQVMFALQNLPPRRFELPGLEITAYSTGGGTSKFDLNLLLTELDGRLLGTLEYNSDLFDALHGAAPALQLRDPVARPGRGPRPAALGHRPLAEAERHQVLFEWNDTAAPFPGSLCLHQPFEARAASRPDAVAVLFEGRALTYGELNRRANRLAHRLRSAGRRTGAPRGRAHGALTRDDRRRARHPQGGRSLCARGG